MKYNRSLFGIDQDSSIDSEKIRQVQNALDITFSHLYLDLVTYADEAAPEISSFSYEDEETCISEFFPFSSEATPYTISWYLGPGCPPKLPKGRVPILHSNIHTLAPRLT